MRLLGITHMVDCLSAIVEACGAAAFAAVVSVFDEVDYESAYEGVEDECGGYPEVLHVVLSRLLG